MPDLVFHVDWTKKNCSAGHKIRHTQIRNNESKLNRKDKMLVTLCKSKIHKAVVTEAVLDYEGSITIDEHLMKEANLLPYELVQVLNQNNGVRFETYVMVGKPGSGTICLNGPAARLGQVGDTLIIIAYCILKEEEAAKHKPGLIFLNQKNKIVKKNF
jgi:aspartate 1-decarboxylase